MIPLRYRKDLPKRPKPTIRAACRAGSALSRKEIRGRTKQPDVSDTWHASDARRTWEVSPRSLGFEELGVEVGFLVHRAPTGARRLLTLGIFDELRIERKDSWSGTFLHSIEACGERVLAWFVTFLLVFTHGSAPLARLLKGAFSGQYSRWLLAGTQRSYLPSPCDPFSCTRPVPRRWLRNLQLHLPTGLWKRGLGVGPGQTTLR